MRKDGERGIKNISLKQTFCNNKEQKVYTLIESLIYEYIEGRSVEKVSTISVR